MNKLIWAEDDLLAQEAVEDATASAEVVVIDAEAGLEGLEQAVFGGSLFSERRVVVVRGAQALTKAGAERLMGVLRRPGQPADVLVVAVSDRPPPHLLAALAGGATVVRLTRPRRGELVAWVAKRLRRAGLEPGRDVAAALVEIVGERLRDLAQAVDQLALRAGRGGRVERADVEAHFTPSAEQPVWVLFDHIVKREGAKALTTLRSVLGSGEDPLPVLGALVSQVRGIMRTKSLVERSPGLSERDLAQALKTSEGRAAVLRRQASRLSWEWLLEVHGLLARADLELKGGEDGAVLPPQMVLERLVAAAIESR